MGNDASFKVALDNQHQWPCDYLFKFVVPSEKTDDFIAVFPGESFQYKKSGTGKYTSLSLRKRMVSSDEVMAIYRAASAIEGIIAL